MISQEDIILHLIIWAVVGIIPLASIASAADTGENEFINIDYSKFKSKTHIALWIFLSGPIAWILCGIKFAFIGVVLILWHPCIYLGKFFKFCINLVLKEDSW